MVQVLREKGKVTGWKTTCCKCGESVTFRKKNEGPWGVNETPTTPDEHAQCGPCWEGQRRKIPASGRQQQGRNGWWHCFDSQQGGKK